MITKQLPWSLASASERLTATKNRIRSDEAALKYVFTQTFLDEADGQLAGINQCSDSPLCGALVSVKDLFDVKGFVTKAGTTFMADDPPAHADAPPIQSLRDAGAILLGHTNMTELAYSGLGLNPHYGTPENALSPGCIPGGSTAGGAVSVAQAVADIAMGTDTGGSLRIPAAFNGIVGFKPSQNTVSRKGCKALSRSLDSVGPMAKTVAACEAAYTTIANTPTITGLNVDEEFIIPNNYCMHDLEPPVQAAFEHAESLLLSAGYKVTRQHIDSLDALKQLAIWHFASIEARGEYEEAYQNKRHMMDPRIAGPTRMGRADEVSAAAYRQSINLRQKLIHQYRTEMDSKILLLPTVPIMPPTFASMEDDDEYSRVNLQVLRNPSIANVMDCCSISLPHTHADATIGIMLTASANHDLSLLKLAEKCEQLFSQ